MKAILFDLDDTLVDRAASIRASVGPFRRHYASQLERIHDEDILASVLLADGGGYHSRSEMCLELTLRLPWKVAPSATDLEKFWRSNFPPCAIASEGVEKVLRSLAQQDFQLGIVSNGTSKAQHTKIDTLGSVHS